MKVSGLEELKGGALNRRIREHHHDAKGWNWPPLRSVWTMKSLKSSWGTTKDGGLT